MRLGQSAALLFVAVSLSACASAVPPNRLADYLGREALSEPVPPPLLPHAKIKAGLMLISDTTAPDAAPSLPDEALNQLAERLQQELSQFLPVSIEKIIPAEGIRPHAETTQFSELGKKHGVDYLMVVVASSTEQEYPMYVFLMWVSHMQPGLRRDNWSLMEAALLDVKSGQTLLHAEGRGWATLDRPMAPGVNQWYPVVFLQPGYGALARHWWPPTYEGAPNTLRVISMQEAVKRLVPNLQDAWNQKRQAELVSAQG